VLILPTGTASVCQIELATIERLLSEKKLRLDRTKSAEIDCRTCTVKSIDLPPLLTGILRVDEIKILGPIIAVEVIFN